MILSWQERQARVEARGAEYRAGLMTEAQFSAYLFSMRYRGHDIRHELNNYAPPPPAQTFEQHRLERSHDWLRRYLGCLHS